MMMPRWPIMQKPGALLLLLLAGSWNGADMRPLDLIRDSGNMATYAADFFPPNFSQWKLYLSEIVITLQIALWGTVLAVVTAILLGLLALPLCTKRQSTTLFSQWRCRQ